MKEYLMLVTPQGEVSKLENSMQSIAAAIGGTHDFMLYNKVIGVYTADDAINERMEFNFVAAMLLHRAIFGPVVISGAASDDGHPTTPGGMVQYTVETCASSWRDVLQAASIAGQEVIVRANPDTMPVPQVTSWERFFSEDEEGGDEHS